MVPRYLEKVSFHPRFGRQMRFISGPRQVGKTTLAKHFLEEKHCSSFYYNWDLRSTKTQLKTDHYFFHSDIVQKSKLKEIWICFDEIHKFPKWKNLLKDYFDSFEQLYQFMITGSARLDVFRKSGDALSGRFFMFKLLPISLFELTQKPLNSSAIILPLKDAKTFINEKFQASSTFAQTELESLIQFGGFPEPLLRSDPIVSAKWHEEYIDTLIREDLRDLTKIQELENVATLMYLLPERIGAPLSVNSLREEMDVSYNAVKNYLRALNLTYVIFFVPPYSKRIHRTLKKEKKAYFWDWSQIRDEAKRFENYVAVELKNHLELWSNLTPHKFDLFFIKTLEGKETDFLITKDQKPYFLIEVKLSNCDLESHHITTAKKLGSIPVLQILYKSNVTKVSKDKDHYIISASRFFA